LLHIEEALSLRYTSIEYKDKYLIMTLDHRKDAPDGNVKPFVLHRNDIDQHLCPVRAYLRWIRLRASTPGPLFLLDKQGMLIEGCSLTYNSFKYRFEVELQKIGVSNWNLYGTHSFRRGGCQYYLYIRGKTLGDIYAWGGWNSSSVATRYMIGSNDNVEHSRQEFTRPPKTGICSECRRKYDVIS
jgi:hypothetical protein